MTDETARGGLPSGPSNWGDSDAKVGLVLSGGGAKGAYQAGVLRALTEEGLFATHVAGASIGALNGAVVAAAASQQQAVEHLRQLWLRLAERSPLKANAPAYITMLASLGMMPSMVRHMASMIGALSRLTLPPSWQQALQSHLPDFTSLLSSQPVANLLHEYLPAGGLPARVPLYVSLFPTEGALQDVMRLIGAELGLGRTADSHFVHVQSLPADEQKQALMASAALPLLFTPQEVNGRLYSDGGQGGWSRLQGNTPIQPLLDAGCRAVVVTHLEDGSMWNRHDFQQAEIIEIRPSGIGRKGTVGDVLGFDNQLIAQWMEQGYEDTRACLGRIRAVVQAHAELQASARARDAALQEQSGRQALQEAMRRL